MPDFTTALLFFVNLLPAPGPAGDAAAILMAFSTGNLGTFGGGFPFCFIGVTATRASWPPFIACTCTFFTVFSTFMAFGGEEAAFLPTFILVTPPAFAFFFTTFWIIFLLSFKCLLIGIPLITPSIATFTAGSFRIGVPRMPSPVPVFNFMEPIAFIGCSFPSTFMPTGDFMGPRRLTRIFRNSPPRRMPDTPRRWWARRTAWTAGFFFAIGMMSVR